MQTDPTREVALRWLAAQPVFLDTETTGLDNRAEICEIAVLDPEGCTLLDTLVKPRQPIPQAATDVHGISDTDAEEVHHWDLGGTRTGNHRAILLLISSTRKGKG